MGLKYRIRPGSDYSAEFIQLENDEFPFDDGILVEECSKNEINLKLIIDRVYGHGDSFESVTIQVPKNWFDFEKREIKENIKSAILKDKIKVIVKCEELGWD